MENNKITEVKELRAQLPGIVQNLDALRAGSTERRPVDISLGEFVQKKFGISMDAFYEKIDINPRTDTMQNIFTMPDQDIKWLVPEVIREAITVGLRQAPFYPNLITADTPVNTLTTVMPRVNMSDAAPAKVNEAETIPLGTVSFGQKHVTLFKIGKGFKITDEVMNYVALDILSIYFRDFGIQLGYALDTLALDVLMNGNMGDGSESAPVVGVYDTDAGIAYKDLLHIWVRAARMGRNFTTLIGGEDQAIELLDLPEFKIRQQGTTEATLTVHSPVPNRANFYIHPGVPETQLMLIDTAAALMKLTAKQLMMESERIVSNQTSATYATLTTGFCKMYQDAVLMLDADQKFSEAGFPDFMDIDPLLLVSLE